MKSVLALVFMGLFAAQGVSAQATSSDDDPLFVTMDEVDLKQFMWKKRPVVVFADSENDPAYIEQIKLLLLREAALRERDVVVITDTNPEAESALRRKLRPRGFMLTLIGKDGGVKMRKPSPWDVREISRSIDKMTIRQREIREQKELQLNN